MKSSLELFRFLFICIIAIWHDNTLNIFSHSVVVEFFFIQSGFLLYLNFNKNNYSPLCFAKKRLKRLYCEYFFALLITLIINIVKEPTNNAFISSQLSSLLPELFMIQSIGLFEGGINPVNWYINVLFVGSFFLYALLYCNSKYANNILIPALALCGLTYFFSTGDSVVRWETNGFVYLPLLRGLCSMSVGIMYAYIYQESCIKSFFSLFLINLLSVVAIVLIFVATGTEACLDRYVIFLSPFIIIACFEDKSWLNYIFHSKWQLWLGRISYPMLLIHCAYIPLFHKLISVLTLQLSIEISFGVKLSMYLILLVLLSALFQKFCDIIRNNISRLFDRVD